MQSFIWALNHLMQPWYSSTFGEWSAVKYLLCDNVGFHTIYTYMICRWKAHPLHLVIEIIHINQLKDLCSVPAEEKQKKRFRSFIFSRLRLLTYLRPWRWQLPEKWLGLLPWLFSHSNKTCSACCTWGWTKWLRSHWRAGPAPPIGPAHWSYWLQGWRTGCKSNGKGMEVGK